MGVYLVRARKVARKCHCSKMCPLLDVMKILKRRIESGESDTSINIFRMSLEGKAVVACS